MTDIQGIITELSKDDIVERTIGKKLDGYRLVQICAVRTSDGYELDYSFADTANNMETFRVNIGTDDDILSVSSIYPCAFLYENEMKELFGVNINLISIDYNNKLYRIKEETPFKNKEERK